jgi:hypothetical protein
MEHEQAAGVAAAWVEAWNSGDPERILSLLHANAVIADPEAGKVRGALVPPFVRKRRATSPEVRSWFSLPGADSVAVVANLDDGARRVDTLVIAEDGRVVRVMWHWDPD